MAATFVHNFCTVSIELLSPRKSYEILRIWNVLSYPVVSTGIRITGSLTGTDGFSLRAPSGGTQGLLSLLFYDEHRAKGRVQ